MKIALIGYGKMGKAIEQVAVSRGHEIVLAIHSGNASDLTEKNMSGADVALEFTGPATAFGHVKKCIDLHVPVVCGSTGWMDNWEEIRSYCKEKNGTLVYASNYSIGVNLFFELNLQLAKLMSAYPSYDVLLEEIHHTQKKDAPSGTAITLAEQVLQQGNSKKQWVNHRSNDRNDLVITSRRTDPAPGTHKVKYHSPVDDIEITHTAHNREGFAGGAVLAAEFIAGKKGIYTMKEVLGL